MNQTAGDDFDARLVAAIRQWRQIVELRESERVRSGRCDQRIALRVERSIPGFQFRRDRTDAPAGDGDAAGGVAGCVQQMDRAALMDRRGGQQNAVLRQTAPGQRDIAAL